MNTTRRYPRTINEAFKGADYANCTEGSQRHPADKWVNRMLVIAMIAVILSVAFGVPS